jgi:hypothetical protein
MHFPIISHYGLNGPGIKIFRACPERFRHPPSPLYNGYRIFPGVKQKCVEITTYQITTYQIHTYQINTYQINTYQITTYQITTYPF